MVNIRLSHPTGKIVTKVNLVASKSECNRALIINALTNNKSTLHNISTARDSVTMQKLLKSNENVLDVIDAGTTMRFLTAYSCLQEGEKTLTGTERMCERPIGILVDALRSIGADIQYLGKEGYPPIKVKGPIQQTTNQVTIRGDVSSQFISALLMIAPNLPKGLELHLTGEIGSKPYINMTLHMMKDFGIRIEDKWDRIIKIEPKKYTPTEFYIESDWSGASYWFSMALLSSEAKVELNGLKEKSLQGDAVIANILNQLGLKTTYKSHSVELSPVEGFKLPKSIEVDFTECPDIAQTIAVICAALKVNLTLTGVESLKVKETDRILALKNELAKFNVTLKEHEKNTSYLIESQNFKFPASTPVINTYLDHRMAMAFAPLALLGEIIIEDKDVVVKSYPSFWDDLEKAGFVINV
ncbi:MAG: 3-phosphoshikimate 1-carboxyvinyltransferase [Bacteroidota bacterium]|nr:3-phosphoshikimate 1-carboxyvinyltransferase [Bacteroidota bacterium]